MFKGKRIRAIAFFTTAIFLGFTLTLEYSFAQEKKKAAQVMDSQQVNSSIEENTEMVQMETGKNGENAESRPLVIEKIEKSPQLKKKKKFPWLWALLGAGATAAVLIVLITKKKNSSGPYMNGVLTVNGVRYELAAIPAGEFQMGKDSSTHADEKPVHTVRISKEFWLGKTEVTQGLWRAVMGNNPAQFPNGDNYPVEYVSWDDCQTFIQSLNLLTGENFRLPTEAEWEYACLAGTTGDRYGDLDAIAWSSYNAGGSTHPVGMKQSNGWGLYDMLGNVWEWCQDWYGADYYSQSPVQDPPGPSSGSYRINRGSGCLHSGVFAIAYLRSHLISGSHFSDIGFRLASDSAGD